MRMQWLKKAIERIKQSQLPQNKLKNGLIMQQMQKNKRQATKQKTDQALRATDRERSSRPELLDHAVHVLPDGDEWIVKTAHAKQAANRYQVKEEAIERGKEIAINIGEQLAIHKQSGQIQDVLSY